MAACKQNDVYCPGDMIRVMEQSRAAILLVTGGIIRLDEKTTVHLQWSRKRKNLPHRTYSGELRISSADGRGLSQFSHLL